MSQALRYVGPNCLEWHEVARPRIRDRRDAIVRPVASTTCDLDVRIIRGLTSFQGPFDIGHECIAEVVEVGEDAVGFQPGQLVIVSWHFSCGACDRCARDLMRTCAHHPPGAMFGMPVAGDWGGLFSDLVRVPFAAATLLPLPAGLEPTHLASLSDNIPFGYELTVPHLAFNAGADVLVVGGAGSVALFAVAFAKAAGAGRVDYLDTDRARLQIAAKLGASVSEGPIPKAAGSYRITVDASGSAEGLLCAVRSTERDGYCSSIGAEFGHSAMPMFEMHSGGIHFSTGRARGRPHLEDALAFVSAGRVHPELITSEVQPFEQSHEVLREPSMKPILVRSTMLSDAYRPKAPGVTQAADAEGIADVPMNCFAS